MTKIFIATPAFDGKTHVQYTISLAETHTLLYQNGVEVKININSSGSLLIAERNRLNKAFLASDCTHMLCIDSDLGWPAHAVLGMLNHDVDFIGGCYPARGENVFLFRPFKKEDGSLIKHSKKDILLMQYIPSGFMLIKRHVIERMNSHFSHLYFEPKNENLKHENGYCLFNTEVLDGEFWGEDYVFCRRAREAGFDIWVDPLIEFDHAGTRGMLASVLTNEKPENKDGNDSQ